MVPAGRVAIVGNSVEEQMPFLMVHESPGGTQEQYDEVCARLTDGGALSSLSDWPTDGVLAHTAGPTDNGWRVVDVWESEEAFQRFGGVIGPILEQVGMPGQPQLSPLHNFVK